MMLYNYVSVMLGMSWWKEQPVVHVALCLATTPGKSAPGQAMEIQEDSTVGVRDMYLDGMRHAYLVMTRRL